MLLFMSFGLFTLLKCVRVLVCLSTNTHKERVGFRLNVHSSFFISPLGLESRKEFVSINQTKKGLKGLWLAKNSRTSRSRGPLEILDPIAAPAMQGVMTGD
jgi:hypothetical protein